MFSSVNSHDGSLALRATFEAGLRALARHLSINGS